MYNELKQEINQYISTNGARGISGAILNTVLNDMVDALGSGSGYGGMILPSSQAPQTDGNEFFITTTAGTYTNFSNIVVGENELAFVRKSGNGWVKDSIQLGVGGVSVYSDLTDKPQINSVELDGNKSSSDLGLATAEQGLLAATAYQKPQTGIPESDLSSDVQTSLGKADTAVQQVTVGTTTTGAAGTSASVTNSGTSTAPVLDFTIPRGADGQDAVNPFKGWWPDLATLKAAHTAIVGDSAYVHDASPATTWSIYIYDSTASTDNYWADSGTNVDTSNVQTFASGEEVNEVHIVKDLTTGGEDDVLSAEQGKALNDIKQDKVIRAYEYTDITASSVVAGYIGADGIISGSSLYTTKFYPVVQGNTYKIKGRHTSGKSSYLYAYYNGDTHIVSLEKTTSETVSQEHEMEITVPTEGTITHVAVEWYGTSSSVATFCKLKTQAEQYTIEDVKANVDTLDNTVSDLNDDIVDLDSKIHTNASTNYNWLGESAYTLAVGSAPSINTASGYESVYIQNLQVGDIVNAHCRAGSSYKQYAKVKNGLCVDVNDNSLVDTFEITVDDTFDALVFNNYYISQPKATMVRKVLTTEILSDEIVELQEIVNNAVLDLYIDVNTNKEWTIGSFLDSPTIGSAPSFNSDNSYSYTYIQNLQVGDIVNAHCRAGSSSNKKYGAKLKNGVIVEILNLSTQATNNDRSWTVDDTFDAIILNNYNGYISTDNVSAVVVSQELITNVLSDEIDDLQETVNDIIEQGVGGEFNMLCFGNSFTQDTISYVPWLVKECEPNIKLNVYFTYMGGMPISQCLAYISNGTVIALNSEGNPSTKYENHGGWDRIYSYSNGEWVEPSSSSSNYHKSYTLYKYDDGANFWVSQSEPTAAEVLAMKNWDLITIQQGGSFNYASWDYYFKPYVYKIQAELNKQVGHNFRFGYLMTHASYSNDYNTLLTRYSGVVSNATNMMENTPVEVLLPYATALQNARTTYLNRFCPSRVYSATLKNGLVKTVNRTNQTTITCDGTFNEVIVNNYYDSSEPGTYIQNPSVLKNGTELTGWVNGSYSMYENSKPIFLNSDGTLYTSLYITGLVDGDVLTINAKNTLAGQNLLGDTAHVNEGVGVLTCAYANTMTVLDMIGSKKTVIGSQIFPDASWVSSHNIPAASTYVLGLTPYNIFLCQQCAVMAYKYPLQLTDMVSKGMCGAIEITLDNLNVISSNPMLSANNGDSWSTTLTGKSGYTITSISVSMGGTDITSTAVSGSTITIDNVSDTVIIDVSGTQS